MAVCYRHPQNETGVSCSSCGRPICPDCMTATSVGMRCPECGKQTTKVRAPRALTAGRPVVTLGLIVVNVLVFLGTASQGALVDTSNSQLLVEFGLYGPLVDSEPWRLVSAGFLHAGIIHIAFNMYILWFLGEMIEPAIGSVRFAALYFAALLTGSLGALVVEPNALTVGASGAVFGLMGAAFVMQRARGIDPMQSGIGIMILINLAIGFVIPGISVGGHVGGLIGGVLAAWLIEESGRRRLPAAVPLLACLLVAVVGVAGAFAVT